MRVLQYPVSKRFALLTIAVFALIVLCTASRARAESTVYSNPQVNVFLRFAKEKGPLFSEGYSERIEIYRYGRFVRPSPFEIADFGQLETTSGKSWNKKHELIWKSEGVSLKLEPYEQLIAIQTGYQLSNGRQIPFKWDGKGQLPMHRHFGKVKASLAYIDVGVHSPELEDQAEQPEPEYQEMH